MVRNYIFIIITLAFGCFKIAAMDNKKNSPLEAEMSGYTLIIENKQKSQEERETARIQRAKLNLKLYDSAKLTATKRKELGLNN